MKILLVSSKYHPEYSGSGLRAHNTYKRLKKNYKIEFNVLSNSIALNGNKNYLYDGIEIIRISQPFTIPPKKTFWRKILIIFAIFWQIFFSWKYIRKKIDSYDLVHTFGNTYSIGFLSWYFSKKNKPVIRELCNDMDNPFYPVIVQNYMRSIFKKNNTLIIAISKRLKNLAKNHYVRNIWYRPNPVDEKKYFIDYKNKYSLRNKLTKFNNQDKVLALIANFIDRKNQLFAIDVLKLLPKKFKLILAGPLKKENSLYFQNLIKKINKLELNDRIEIRTEFLDNFDEYLKCSDVFLFPSKAEGLGTPLLESQACGVPVVSNYIRGITDTVIKRNEGGYFLDLNAKNWAEAIHRALDIPKEVLENNSKYISTICSSKLIDEEYYIRIRKLIFSEN